MDIKQIIESGILEDYVLGMLDEKQAKEVTGFVNDFPLIKYEVIKIENSLMRSHSKQLSNNSLPQIEKIISLLTKEEHLDLENLPLIHKHTSLNKWKVLLADVVANELQESLDVNVLKSTDQVTLCLAWLRGELIEDGHDSKDFQESFFILEGSCECNFDGKIFNLKAGDFIDIPFQTKHSFKNTSKDLDYVKALIQRVKIAV